MTSVPQKTSPTELELFKTHVGMSLTRRKPQNIAVIGDLVRDIPYFKQVAENAGVKTLYEYCKYIELQHFSANVPIKNVEIYLVVLCGKVMCRNKQAVLRNYTDGQEIGQISQELEYMVIDSTYILTIKMSSMRRLTALQEATSTGQKKKYEKMVKKSQQLAMILTALQSCQLFKTVPTFDLKQFALKTVKSIYMNGEKIYEQGKFPQFLFLLVQGKVSIVYKQAKQNSMNKNFMHRKKANPIASTLVNQKEIFGLEQLFEDKPYIGSAIATSPEATILAIPMDLFKDTVNMNFMKAMCESIVTLIETRKVLLEKYKESAKHKEQPQFQIDLMEKLKVNIRLSALAQHRLVGKGEVRSTVRERPFRCYFPTSMLHKNPMTMRFTGPRQQLALNLIEEELKLKNQRKQHHRTRSTFSHFQVQQSPDQEDKRPASRKSIYERVIIGKLEQLQTLDKTKLLQATDDRNSEIQIGSTMNFFRVRQRNRTRRQSSEGLSTSKKLNMTN